MKRWLLVAMAALAPICACTQPGLADTAVPASSCGTRTLTAGQPAPMSQDTTGKLCVNATVSANVAPIVVTPTDRGGTVTTGGTAQNAMASNASRKGGWIENPCTATEDLYISTSATATTTGVGDDADLAPCGTYSLIQTGGLVIQSAVSVVAATTAHRFIAKETQ